METALAVITGLRSGTVRLEEPSLKGCASSPAPQLTVQALSATVPVFFPSVLNRQRRIVGHALRRVNHFLLRFHLFCVGEEGLTFLNVHGFLKSVALKSRIAV